MKAAVTATSTAVAAAMTGTATSVAADVATRARPARVGRVGRVARTARNDARVVASVTGATSADSAHPGRMAVARRSSAARAVSSHARATSSAVDRLPARVPTAARPAAASQTRLHAVTVPAPAVVVAAVAVAVVKTGRDARACRRGRRPRRGQDQRATASLTSRPAAMTAPRHGPNPRRGRTGTATPVSDRRTAAPTRARWRRPARPPWKPQRRNPATGHASCPGNRQPPVAPAATRCGLRGPVIRTRRVATANRPLPGRCQARHRPGRVRPTVLPAPPAGAAAGLPWPPPACRARARSRWARHSTGRVPNGRHHRSRTP